MADELLGQNLTKNAEVQNRSGLDSTYGNKSQEKNVNLCNKLVNGHAQTQGLSKENLAKDKLIVALDYSSIKEAKKVAEQIEDQVTFFKIGMELLFQEGGIDFAKSLKEGGKKIFFDAKAFDIPRTVEAAVDVVSELGFDFMSVHIPSYHLLKKLAERKKRKDLACQIIGITLLTSIGDKELKWLGIKQSPEELVLTLADIAMEVGRLDGLVASGREIAKLREKHPETILIAPGIRLHGSPADDQKRTSTPHEAIAANADYIVVGRPITRAKNPNQAIQNVLEGIESGMEKTEESRISL